MPQNQLIDAAKEAVKRWRQAIEEQQREKPKAPASTGPAVGPPGVMRAETAARYGMSDRARSEMARVPVAVKEIPAGGYYIPQEDRMEISKDMPSYNQSQVLGHEMAHRQWFQNPRVSDDESGYVKDVLRLANDPRYPAMAQAVRNWAAIAQSDTYGGVMHPTELDARVVEFGGRGEQAPEWFRQKWGQDIWRDVPRGEGPMRQPVEGYRTPFGYMAKTYGPTQGPSPYRPVSRWEQLADSGFSQDQ